MGTYKLSEDAVEDLIRIHQQGIKLFGEEQADNYFNAFFDCFGLISEQPLLYQAVDDIREGYRRCVCGVDSVDYRVTADGVEIMSILRYQNIPDWL